MNRHWEKEEYADLKYVRMERSGQDQTTSRKLRYQMLHGRRGRFDRFFEWLSYMTRRLARVHSEQQTAKTASDDEYHHRG